MWTHAGKQLLLFSASHKPEINTFSNAQTFLCFKIKYMKKLYVSLKLFFCSFLKSQPSQEESWGSSSELGFGLGECCGWSDHLSRPLKLPLYQQDHAFSYHLCAHWSSAFNFLQKLLLCFHNLAPQNHYNSSVKSHWSQITTTYTIIMKKFPNIARISKMVIKWANGVGKMVPTGLLDAALPQTFNLYNTRCL